MNRLDNGLIDVSDFERIGGGKTKDIYVDPSEAGIVYIRSRDDISAGDGARKDIMTGKAELSTTTTVNNFQYLEYQGVGSHFVNKVDPVTFRAIQCTPIPIELVARRFVAGGSFPKRVPWIPQHHRFDEPVIEMFWKQDVGEYTDPFMVYDYDFGLFRLHPAKEPTTLNNVVGVINASEIPGVDLYDGAFDQLLDDLHNLTSLAFYHLGNAYEEVGLTVVDYKIEAGVTPSGDLVIIDVIDADSWRAWVDGDPEKAVDKQYFRDHPGEPADTSLPAFRYVAEKSAEIVAGLTV